MDLEAECAKYGGGSTESAGEEMFARLEAEILALEGRGVLIPLPPTPPLLIALYHAASLSLSLSLSLYPHTHAHSHCHTLTRLLRPGGGSAARVGLPAGVA